MIPSSDKLDQLRPVIFRNPDRQWKNWHLTVHHEVGEMIDIYNQTQGPHLERYRNTTELLMQLIGEAQSRDMPVRALGSGWSFSEAAVTDGYLINTKNLELKLRVQKEDVHPESETAASHLYFVQCGVSIAKINETLESRGLSLATSGGANGQTIAGAVIGIECANCGRRGWDLRDPSR